MKLHGPRRKTNHSSEAVAKYSKCCIAESQAQIANTIQRKCRRLFRLRWEPANLPAMCAGKWRQLRAVLNEKSTPWTAVTPLNEPVRLAEVTICPVPIDVGSWSAIS
jgi:hypothetical protein